MRMPRGTSTGFEGDMRALYVCRFRCLKEWIDSHSTGEPICWSFRGRLRTDSLDVHNRHSLSYLLLNSLTAVDHHCAADDEASRFRTQPNDRIGVGRCLTSQAQSSPSPNQAHRMLLYPR